MTEFILKILILVWPFGHLMRFTIGETSIYALDVGSLLLAITILVSSNTRGIVRKNQITIPLLAYLSVCVFSLIVNIPSLSSIQILRAMLYLIRLFTYPSIFYAVQLIKWERIKSSVLLSATVFLLLCGLQYLLMPDLTSMKYLGFDDHYYRLTGTLLDPNYTGLILVLLATIFMHKGQYLKLLTMIPLIALTFSRASYLTLSASVLITSLIKKSYWILISVLVLVIAIVLTPKPFGEGVNLSRTFSITSRINSMASGLKIFYNKPVFGVGYNTLVSDQGQRVGIDNSFIYLLATTGLLGTITFLNLLKAIIQKTKDRLHLLVIVLILIHSLFNNSLFYIWVFSVFWFTAGLSKGD